MAESKDKNAKKQIHRYSIPDIDVSELKRPDIKRMGVYCVNFNLRKATRTVTRFYDEVLEPCGITSTQQSILLAIRLNNQANVGKLARLLFMDRTTLTRNLKLLEKTGLIAFTRAEDGRQKLVSLTDKGSDVFEKSIPLWRRAQEEILEIIEEANWRQTLMNISRVLKDKEHHDS